MRFVLTVELGNDAMRTQGDIADALRRTFVSLGASSLESIRSRIPEIGDSGPIHDLNGNRVGGWHVE